VLSIRPFRRLWIATSLSSLGDWLSLVALSTLASDLAGHGVVARGAAVGGVWLTSLLPALLLGPLAGAVADRLDRRLNMIVGDVLRAVLYLSLVLNLSLGFANELTWMYAVQFLASCASLFWTPAKDASVPNLVPRDKLEEANQYSLLGTFGPAPIAWSAGHSGRSRRTSPPTRDRSSWRSTSTRPPSSSPRSPSTCCGRSPSGR
jgi:dTMP kinase